MALITKLLTKSTLTALKNTNSTLAPKSNACQNLAHMDITNSANKLDSALNSNSKKTNIIVIYSNIEKY